MEDTKRSGTLWQWIGRLLGPLLAFAVWVLPTGLHEVPGFGDRPAVGAAVAVLMATWWFTEALPIGVTACVPLVVFPLLGVTGGGFKRDLVTAAEPFADAYLLLFLGGMLLGAGLEHWNLHRRLALRILERVGSRPRNLLAGVLIATAAVSMWISNTATAVMMLPIASALLSQLEEEQGRRFPNFGAALMLSVAYASNVGGIGTKIGTATNSIFSGLLVDRMHYEIGFLQYIALGLPFVLLFLPVVWGALWWLGRVDGDYVGNDRAFLRAQLEALGPMSREERRMLAVFACAAVLWIVGDPLRELIAPKVSALWPSIRIQSKHYEAGVACLAALFAWAIGLLPSRKVLEIPWVTLLLLGGSFALAAGIDASGLSRWMASQVSGLSSMSLWAQILLASLATITLSAVASNVATINVMFNVLPPSLPVLFTSSVAASCDFALPAGTPPNAIVFGSRRVRLPTMMRVGAVLDLAAVLLLTAYGALYLKWML